MRAAAQLGREVADLDHAHPIAVLLAEERHRAGLEGLVEIHLARRDGRVGLHLLVHQILDAADLTVVHLAAMREVESQVIGSHQRPRLGHVRAEHLPQSGVEEVRAGMVLTQALAARGVDRHRHLVVLAQRALRHLHAVDDHLGAAIVRVEDLAATVASHDRPGVAHLAAGLGVSGRLIEDDVDGLALARLALTRPVTLPDHRPDLRRRRQELVAEELLGAERLRNRGEKRPAVRAVPDGKGRARPGALPLGFHLLFPRRLGLRRRHPAPVVQLILGQVAGEPERVVQGEQEASVDRAPATRALGLRVFLDPIDAGVQHRGESLLLLADRALDAIALALELRVGVAHVGHDALDGLPEERAGDAELAGVAHRPPHDAPQDVAAPFVRRLDAIGDEERGRPRVVRDDAHRHAVVLGARRVRLAREPLDLLEHVREQVRVVVRLLALNDRRDALEAHAGVD